MPQIPFMLFLFLFLLLFLSLFPSFLLLFLFFFLFLWSAFFFIRRSIVARSFIRTSRDCLDNGGHFYFFKIKSDDNFNNNNNNNNKKERYDTPSILKLGKKKSNENVTSS